MLTLLAPIAMQGSEHWVFIERETPRLETVALKKALGVKKEEAHAGTTEVKMSTSLSKVVMAVGRAKEVAGQEEPADAALDTRTRAKMIASPEDFESVWEDDIYEKETRGEPSQEAEHLPAESAEEEPRERGEEATTSEPGLPNPCQQPQGRQRAKILGPEPPQAESELVTKERASTASRKQEAGVQAAATEIIKIKVKASDDGSETSATQRIIYLGDPEGEKDSKSHLLLENGEQLGLEVRPEATVNTSGEGSRHVAPVAEGFQPSSSTNQQHRTVSGKPAVAAEQPGTGCDRTSLAGRPTSGQEEGLPLQQEKASTGLTGCEAPEGVETLPCSREMGPEEMDLQSPVGGLRPCGLAGVGHGDEEHRDSPTQSLDICTAVEGLSGRTGADGDKEESAQVVLQMEEIESKLPPPAASQQGHRHSAAGSEGDKSSSPVPTPFLQQSSPGPAGLAPGTEGRDLSRGSSPGRDAGILQSVNLSAEVAHKETSLVAGKGAPKEVSPIAQVVIPRSTPPESEEQPQDTGSAPRKSHQGTSLVAGGPPQNTDTAAELMQVRDPATGEVTQHVNSVTAMTFQSKDPATEEPLEEEKPMIKELLQDIGPTSGKLARDEGCGMEELSHDKSPFMAELPPKAEEREQQTEALIRDLPQEGPVAGGLLLTAGPKAREPRWDLEFNAGQDLQGRSPAVGETTQNSDLALGQLPQDKSPAKTAADVPHSSSSIAELCQGSKMYQLSTLAYEGRGELQAGSGTHQIESGWLIHVSGRTGAVSQEHGDVTVAPGSWQESESYRKTSVSSKIKMFEQGEVERRVAQEGQKHVPEAETSSKAKGKTRLAQDMLLNTGLVSPPAVPVTLLGAASSMGSVALGQWAGSGDNSQPLALKEDVSVGLEREGEDSADLASPDSGCELTLAEAVVTLPMNCPDGKFMRMLCGSLFSCSVARPTSID